MKALYKKELRAFLSSIIGTVVLAVFLLVSGLFHWVFPGQWNLLDAGVAEMSGFFLFTPWIFLFLIPAITMRLFAEEHRTGSIELLVTLPVGEAAIVLGKFFAALTLVGISILLTLSYPITLMFLSDIDVGPVVGGYLGLLGLSAAFTAIGTAASVVTKNQIIAFMITLMVCIIPFASGFALAQVPATFLPLVQFLSFETHFNNLSRGVIDSRDLLYYISIVGLFLHVAVFGLERRRLR